VISTVVLTRDPAGNRRWAAGLRSAGFAVINAPMIDTVPAALTPGLAATLRQLPDYDWLVITSPRTPPILRALMNEAHVPRAKPPSVAAVGPASAAAAERAGFTVTFVAPTPTSAGLAATLNPVDGRAIALAQANIAPADLAQSLQYRGAHITRLTLYTLTPHDQPNPQLEAKLQAPATAILLASPSAALVLAQRWPAALVVPVVAIGPTTAGAARRIGYTAVTQAAAPDLPSVTSALHLL